MAHSRFCIGTDKILRLCILCNMSSAFSPQSKDELLQAIRMWDGDWASVQFWKPMQTWNVLPITDMSRLFYDADFGWDANSDIGTWNVASVTTMEGMFSSATLFNQPIGKWNTGSVTNMKDMFKSALSFNQLIGSWSTGSVTTMEYMFDSANTFNQPIGDWNIASVINLENLIFDAENFNQPVGDWNTGGITNIVRTFSRSSSVFAPAFNQPIGNWNTASVTTSERAFYYTVAFNQPVGQWNMGKVTTLFGMFAISRFNRPIGDWNTGSVTTLACLFCSNVEIVFNQPIGDWNTGSILTMQSMFTFARRFNQPIGDWNTGSVTTMRSMFEEARAFNQPIDNWNTGSVTTMASMFHSAAAFNQPIRSWRTASVTTMESMFHSAAAFNQPIGDWNMRSIITMLDFLKNAISFCQTSLPSFDSVYASLPPGGRICAFCENFRHCASCEPDRCLLCGNSTYMGRGDLDGRCTKSCPSYFFGNGSGSIGRTCEECEPSCISCHDASTCLECADGKYLHDSRCFYVCFPGTVARGSEVTGRYCLPCEDNCETCLDESTCLTCTQSKYLYNSDCIDVCPQGSSETGLGDVGRICAPCTAVSCLRCPSTNVCEMCDGRYLNNGDCLIECPSGTFAIEYAASWTCQGCGDDCGTCTSISTCSACTNSKYLYEDECVTACPLGTEPLGSGTIGLFCQACASYIHDFDCVNVCPSAWFPDASNIIGVAKVCRPCEIYCVSCVNASTCLVCADSKLLLNDDCVDTCPLGFEERIGTGNAGSVCAVCPLYAHEGRCVNVCPLGTFPEEATGYNFCRPCDQHCSSCTGASTCSQCSDSKYLFDNSCLDSCPLGTSAVGIGHTGSFCQRCEEGGCAVCPDASTCTGCKDSKYLYQGRCLSSCPSRTLTLGYACLECENMYCLNCLTPTVCTTCGNSTYLHKGDCLKECPSGTFRGTFPDGTQDSGLTCQTCQADCSLCVSSSVCLGCMNSKYLDEGKCLEECPSGRVPTGTGSVGLSCHDPSTCSFLFTTSLETGKCEPNWPLWSAIALFLFLVLLALFGFTVRRRAQEALSVAIVANKEATIEAALSRAKQCRISQSNQTVKAAMHQLKVLRGKYTDYEALLQILDRGIQFGDMKLVRGSWLMHPGNIRRLKRQQELPREAFWSPNELRSQLTVVSIVAISYCWLHPVNPDPHSKHLQELQRAIKLRLELKGPGRIRDMAIFLDFASIPQHGEQGDESDPVRGEKRSPIEANAFSNGLKNVNIPYASQLTETWMMKWVPDSEPRKYMTRGWPFFEQAVSSLIKPTPMLIDINSEILNARSWIEVHERGKMGRKPPLIPSKFKKELQSKTFTNGKEDKEFVEGKYEETFKQVVGTATALWFAGVGWTDDDAEAITEIYPFAINLERLLLAENEFTNAGAVVLIQACNGCPSLQQLDLSYSRVCTVEMDGLQQLWNSLGKPSKGLLLEAAQISSRINDIDQVGNVVSDSARAEVVDQESRAIIGRIELHEEDDTSNLLVEL